MQFDVYIRKKDLAAFRKRVLYHFRRKPKHEYLEVIFIREGIGQFHIESFHKVHITKTSPRIVEIDEMHFLALKNEAKSLGLKYGTIHTHTISDSAPSAHDHCSGLEEGETLLGICEVDELKSGRMKTNLVFWIPQMPCRINQITD